MKTFYDVCSNGILHAAITGESVEVDACTTKIFWDSDEDLPDCDEDPIPIRADGEPPTIVIGVIQNQALAMNRIATPKRSFNIVAPNSVPVPPGAQSVLVMGDPSGLTAAQVFTSDGSTTIPFPINTEVDIAPGVWRIDVASADGDQSTVMFGLGI
jgi:hypothetical protein